MTDPILPPISREAHARLVAEAVAAERERIAKWLEASKFPNGSLIAHGLRQGFDLLAVNRG